MPDPKIRIYDVGMKRIDVDAFPYCVHLARYGEGPGAVWGSGTRAGAVWGSFPGVTAATPATAAATASSSKLPRSQAVCWWLRVTEQMPLALMLG